MMKTMRLWTIISLFLFLFSCSNPPYRGLGVCGADDFVIDSYQIREGKFAILEMEGKCFDPLSDDLLNEYCDVIHDGDILRIAVYHPSRADIGAAVASIGDSIGFRVHEGKVHLPDLEPVAVGGLSCEDAAKEIEKAYRREINYIEVFVSYRDRTERKVELMGMVSLPTIPVDGKIRLFEVLALARVPHNANFYKSYVVREQKLLPVDLYKLVKEGDMSQNIVMRGGDKVYVADPGATNVIVLGEVNKPRVIDMPNGFLTVRQAIAEAGGIPYTGDRRYIQVIRGGILHPKIYTLNWQHIVRLPNDSLLLIPGDIVYVAATPIAEWNRFVNQILPTIVGLDIILRGAKSVGIVVP